MSSCQVCTEQMEHNRNLCDICLEKSLAGFTKEELGNWIDVVSHFKTLHPEQPKRLRILKGLQGALSKIDGGMTPRDAIMLVTKERMNEA